MLTKISALLLALAVGLAPAVVRAQGNTEDELEEVIVTAQFRDTELLKSSGSISVVQQATLFDRGAQHLEEILNVLPNVNFSSGASRARFIQVRGVGDLEQFVDPKYFPSVGVTIDDVDMNGLAAAAIMMDIRQVEVLRGPQGTRFGTNALAGMVNIRSNEPGNTFNGYAQAGVGNYSSWNVAAALGGPLSENFQGRIAVRQNSSDGFMRNVFLGRDDTNNRDEFSLRGKLRWLGKGDTRADLTIFYVNIDNGYDAFSLDNNRRTRSDEPGSDQQQSLSIAGKSYWQINTGLALETILSWSDADTQYSYDEDWSNPDICTGVAFCYPYANTDEQDRSRDNISLDIHLLSIDAGRLNWVAGAYAQHRSEDFTRQYYGSFVSAYETQRYAVYGQADYDFSANWRVIAGLRFETFRDEYSDTNNLRSKTDDQYFTGEFTLQHDLNNGTMIYGTLSRGVKPGGVNTEASSVFGFMDPKFREFMQGRLQFGSESLLNREIGIKGRYLDETLTLRAAMFYMNRNDAQLESWIWDDVNFLWVGYLDSVRSGSNYGMELELDYQLSTAVEVFAGIGWLETKVDEITVVDLGQPGELTQSVITVVKGRDQTKAPQWQYNIGANLYFTDQLSARLEIEGRSDSFYGYYHSQKIAGYSLVNASIGYQVGAVTIRAWGRNLAGKDYAVHGLYFANDPRKGYVNETYRQFGEPRVVGIDVKYAF
ncbi:MAG: TonB-dependent receptor [Gammaproteobacteria bacterium]|nr:MAG: TonB-dependent receptor [Gammaproteobacteria bacterium]